MRAALNGLFQLEGTTILIVTVLGIDGVFVVSLCTTMFASNLCPRLQIRPVNCNWTSFHLIMYISKASDYSILIKKT